MKKAQLSPIPFQFYALIFAIIVLSIGLLPENSLAQTRQTEPVVNKSVLLNDANHLIPLMGLDQRKIAVVTANGAHDDFYAQLLRYGRLDRFQWPSDSLAGNRLDESLKRYNTIVFVLDGSRTNDLTALHFIQAQAVGKDVLTVLFGEGQNLQQLEGSKNPVMWHPGTDALAQRQAAMTVFGGLAGTAKLAQTYSTSFKQGDGVQTAKIRLSYSGTAGTTVNTQLLTDSIDAVMEDAIAGRAAPGGVVMVVQDGNVIFEKAYGHHTYEQQANTRLSDIFDMASITKIAATTPVVMRLTERGVINLDSTMGHYLWQAKHSNKAGTKLRDVMLHEAGFIPYIPFYRDMNPNDLSADSSAEFSVKVADGCYIRTAYYEEVMWPIMLNSRLNETGKYVYSDISMYVMKEVSEHQTGIPIEDYIQENFYQSLGMKTAGYNPRERFTKDQIIPTEYDATFRKTLLEGYVHDQGAAMAGGIAGHAGLFATANDLAIYGQLLLNRGVYGGERYFNEETVDLFTSNQSATSRRGLGFDRKDPSPGSRYPSGLASNATYGHTGYTGTCVWMDPESRLIYIFLSNRVHPEVSDQLGNLAIRRRIMDSIYQAIQK